MSITRKSNSDFSKGSFSISFFPSKISEDFFFIVDDENDSMEENNLNACKSIFVIFDNASRLSSISLNLFDFITFIESEELESEFNTGVRKSKNENFHRSPFISLKKNLNSDLSSSDPINVMKSNKFNDIERNREALSKITKLDLQAFKLFSSIESFSSSTICIDFIINIINNIDIISIINNIGRI